MDKPLAINHFNACNVAFIISLETPLLLSDLSSTNPNKIVNSLINCVDITSLLIPIDCYLRIVDFFCLKILTFLLESCQRVSKAQCK